MPSAVTIKRLKKVVDGVHVLKRFVKVFDFDNIFHSFLYNLPYVFTVSLVKGETLCGLPQIIF